MFNLTIWGIDYLIFNGIKTQTQAKTQVTHKLLCFVMNLKLKTNTLVLLFFNLLLCEGSNCKTQVPSETLLLFTILRQRKPEVI